MLECRDRPPGHTVAFFLSMLMVESIFPGYEKRLVSIEDQTISVHIGGTGTPVLLLHGYPQNHATSIKLAVPLARNFTCVIADLPGYGEKSHSRGRTRSRSFPNVEWRQFSCRLWLHWATQPSTSWATTEEQGWRTEWPWIILKRFIVW